MGTGNSFLRDFTREGAEATIPALLEGRRRGCDVVRVEHDAGVFHYLNILCVGWVADVNALRGRRFARFGELGYVFAVLSELAGLHAGTYPLREAGGAWERAPQTFISINNSRFTGGAMMMAPAADTADGKVDVVRVGAMGRIALLRAFPRIFKGTHVDLPVVRASQTAAVEFDLPEPVDVMVDGEALTARLTRLEVLPAAVDLVI
jgi:diacylglycerol kinase (ATP)